MTCLALKGDYRDSLRDLAGDGSVKTHFLMLAEDEKVLINRLEKREGGHYMNSIMLREQLGTLEAPGEEEVDLLPVDGRLVPEVIVDDVLDLVFRV